MNLVIDLSCNTAALRRLYQKGIVRKNYIDCNYVINIRSIEKLFIEGMDVYAQLKDDTIVRLVLQRGGVLLHGKETDGEEDA